MTNLDHDAKVIVICASTLPWQLDPTIRKSFERKIFISLPKKQSRHNRIKINLTDIAHKVSEADL